MRQLILMRGLPGSGKSTWIKNNGLTPFVICPDDIRLLYSSPVMNSDGKLSVNGANDKRVWELTYAILEERMDRGDFIVVDATHKKLSDFGKYLKLATKYLYRIGCADFSHVPLATCLAQNLLRPEYKQVPADVITQQHGIITQHSIPKNVTSINVESKTGLEDWVADSFKHFNLNAYNKIHHIGDIQGCFEPIKEYFKDGFKDDEYYIFTGDLLDRGIQNGEVLNWAIENLIHRENVLLMMGNHERHIMRWIGDLTHKGLEFPVNTLPQIQHLKKPDVSRLLAKLQDCFVYNYGDKQVFVSHGGIGKIPDLNLLPYINGKTFWNGSGVYRDPIDEIFAKNNPDWIQIHGHRNKSCVPLQASANSYNLEGKVEFGGALRIVTLELKTIHNATMFEVGYDGNRVEIKQVEIPNTVHKTNEECLRDY